MNLIFEKIREILHNSYSIHYDQIELETNFELELGMDSREFFEIIVKLIESSKKIMVKRKEQQAENNLYAGSRNVEQ